MIKTPLVLLTALSGMWVTCDTHAEPAKDTLTITCNDDVHKGVLVMSDPPAVNCGDLKMMKSFVGTGFKVGPLQSHEQIARSVKRMIAKLEGKFRDTNFNEIINDKAVNPLSPSPTYEPAEKPNGSYVNINSLPGMSRVQSWKAGVKSHDLDDFGDKRSAAFRELEARSNGKCKGYVNLNDLLSGRCGDVKIKIEE